MSDREDDVFEDEAEQEEGEAGFEDSSEEDEDEDRFEQDDFIVDDEGDDGGDDDGPRPDLAEDNRADDTRIKKKKKRRRRYREDSPELAEGDLQLLEEGGVRIDRKKKLKRLRKGASDDEDNLPLDEELGDLGDDDEEDRQAERRRRADEPVDYDDDLDDFIDDGGRGRRRRAAERDGLVSSDAVRQARSIFGDVDDMTQYRGVGKLFDKGDQGGDDPDDADYVEDGASDDARPLRTIRMGDVDELDDGEDMPNDVPQAEEETIAMQLRAPSDDADRAKQVVAMDVPEQLQYHFGPNYQSRTAAQLKEEGAWIYRHGFQNHPHFQDYNFYKPDAVINKIIVVLSYIHIDKLDIPFIAIYRKDYITPFLIPAAGEVTRAEPQPVGDESVSPATMPPPRGFNSYQYDDYRPGVSYDHLRGVPRGYDDGFGDWSILWHILDLDKRYGIMLKARQDLVDAAKEAVDKGVPPLVIEEVQMMARTSEDERQLKDGDHYLRLAIELAEALKKNKNSVSDYLDEDDTDGAALKRPSRRKNRYSDFCRRGYRTLAEEFGLSAHQFAENFRGGLEYGSGMQLHAPLDPDDEPIEVARIFAERIGESAERAGATEEKLARRLLSAARYILVTEIVSEIVVLNTARSILLKPGTVTITTTPTHQGIAQVDETHPLRFVTSMGDKTLESFANTTDFALVLRAVEMGFTKMEINLQPEQISQFTTLLKWAFAVQGVTSMLVERWSVERNMVVEEVQNSLIDRMKEEIKHDLTTATYTVLRDRLCQAYSRRMLLGPGRPNASDDGCPRVLAVLVTSEDDEEPDPLQAAKEFEEARVNGRTGGERRMARERITFVELDENGEYQTGYELFAAWLRRPTHPTLPQAALPDDVKKQLKAFIGESRAQMITIGIGSGGRSVMRLQTDLMDVITEMILDEGDPDKLRKPLMLGDSEMSSIRRATQDAKAGAREGRQEEEGRKAARYLLAKYVVLEDELPARVYAKTNWSSVGLSVDAMTLLEKRAIALGRLAQEPLWVYAAIGQERDASVEFQTHPHHYFAKPSDRVVALHRALFRAVCVSGVDINRMLRLPHTQPLLAFVGGLGEHKGKALLHALEVSLSEEDRGLQSRKHLWSENYLGRIVFLSTAAFLRVRDPDLHSGGNTHRAVEERQSKLSRKSRGRRRDDDMSGIFDPMDDSRIHPEHYAVAIKIAEEALCDDEGKLRVDLEDAEEMQKSMRMTSAVLDDPSGLERLDLDKYAEDLEKLRRGSLYETVKLIASEFRGPFKDYRRALVSPEPRAVFYLVTCADPLMMRTGSVVIATNCKVRERRTPDPVLNRNVVGISCMLPNGVRGFIPNARFADEELEDDAIKQLVPDGSSLTCRILDFDFEKFEAILTSKTSVVQDPDRIQGYLSLVDKSDPAYRPYPVMRLPEANGSRLLGPGLSNARERRVNLSMKQTVTSLRDKAKPVVTHPAFREVTGSDAIGLLRAMLPGDIVIRPSQYNKDGIIFSCKFDAQGADGPDASAKGVFHKDCKIEHNPDNPDVPSLLKVDDVVYEDIDQVLEEYLRPIISNLTESLEHRKFQRGTERDLEKHVSAAKQRAPNSIPYCFGLSDRSPTSLVLVFIPGTTTVNKEMIKVVPNGYRLRSVLHKNMDVLFTWFKSNMRRTSSAPRVVARESVGASPFGASPFRTSFGAAASPFRGAGSPYRGAQSPFRAAASPFGGGIRPRPTQAPRVPREPMAWANTPDPYKAVPDDPPPPPPRPTYPSDNRGQISADDWSKATLHNDEPPPSRVQNGSYGGTPAPPSPHRRQGDPMRPDNRAAPMRDPPGGGLSRGPPARGPPRRESPRGPAGRGAPPRGPPSRGPPPRGAPTRGGGRGDGEMPTWRGAKPVPAWKKKADEEQAQL